MGKGKLAKFNLLQLENAYQLIEVTLFGILIDVILPYSKAQSPIVVTEFGRYTVRSELCQKARLPIEVIPSDMTKCSADSFKGEP